MPNYLFQGQADSHGRVGPTLQKLFDRTVAKDALQTAAYPAMVGAGVLAPATRPIIAAQMLTDPSTAEASSSAMKKATKLADIFTDWFKGGTPTVNIPTQYIDSVLKSGKLKNQMELTHDLDAWRQRVVVEKELGGIPRPHRKGSLKDIYILIEQLKEIDNKFKTVTRPSNSSLADYVPEYNTVLQEYLRKSGYTPKEALKHPVYGHIYNPKYIDPGTASIFGSNYAEMNDTVKNASSYVLGDSFEPTVAKLFSADDMYGKTSALERHLFNFAKKAEDPSKWIHQHRLNILENNPRELVDFMEMWIPNRLSTLNNVNSMHLTNPNRSMSVKQLQNELRQPAEKSALANHAFFHNTLADDIDAHIADMPF